jgi:hypothetical protein
MNARLMGTVSGEMLPIVEHGSLVTIVTLHALASFLDM